MGHIPKNHCSIPAAAFDLAGFRAWALSPAFPQTGRIDFLAGDLEVDMSPEDLYTHGTIKAELGAQLQILISHSSLGSVFVDRARISSPPGKVSAEPDIVVVLWESVDRGNVREIPSAKKRPGRFIELEGAPDLVVEVLSESSEQKDRKRLPPRYAAAGIPELWLCDARGPVVRFEIRTLKEGQYRLLAADDRDWVSSPLLGRRFKLTREEVRPGRWSYRLLHEKLAS
jgi:Uma2 family endonuclease